MNKKKTGFDLEMEKIEKIGEERMQTKEKDGLCRFLVHRQFCLWGGTCEKDFKKCQIRKAKMDEKTIYFAGD